MSNTNTSGKFCRLLVWGAALSMVLGAFGAARADIILDDTGPLYELSITDPTPVGSAENLLAFVIRLRNISGDADKNPSTFTQNPGDLGILGQLHQVWYFGGLLKTATADDTPAGAPDVLDSHFLVRSDDIVPLAGPSEDKIALSSEIPTSPGEAGFGTYLRGDFTLKGIGPHQWNLAYLVVPLGSTVTFNGRVSGGGVGQNFNTSWEVIPEPGSLLLLLGAGLALAFAWRRRR